MPRPGQRGSGMSHPGQHGSGMPDPYESVAVIRELTQEAFSVVDHMIVTDEER